MLNRIPVPALHLALLSLGSFLYFTDNVNASESKLSAYPYGVKAGVKNGDYEFSVPTRPAETPVVEVYQSNGRFVSILRDKDINFKTGYRIRCGKKWQLEKDPSLRIYGEQKQVVADNLGIFSASSDYAYMMSKMTSVMPPYSLSPQKACNDVVDDRANAGLPVASLLKKGFWTKIDQAYKVELSYSCVRTKKIKRNLHNPTRFSDLNDWQPLFVHCIGDSDQGKEYAKTSKSTNTTSASHADLKNALEKKQKDERRPAHKPTRTNPVNPLNAVNSELQYRALINTGDQRRVVSPPKTLEDFLDYGFTMSSKREMRLVDFETVSINPRRYYIGLWQTGSGTSLLTKPLSVAKFNKLHHENKKKGLRLADFELVKTSSGTRVASLWQSGKLDEQFSSNMSAKGFKQRNAVLKKKGLSPVDIEVFVEAGEIRYAALWRRHSSGQSTSESTMLSKPVQFMPAIDSKEFRKMRDELVAKGKQLVDIERVVKGGKTYIAGLWIDGGGPSGLSKPRSLDQFKEFINSPKAPFVEDLEVHIKNE